ncbi:MULTISPECIES: THUMP-like domain-containing protein [Tsukamurella]|uniref:Class I SAM-dependent methyltransferase n=2 Tax=Tsukamurella TaxID=2060 RepID=A0A5C5S0F9_9ACTN|nr:MULTISPECIES: class I SAM-dependent methyltransferase [Tsukamurella]NMD54673.1 class I SAM-dependent methyltransferase [Tsukamurella columbiensis]TWS28584.1 class I SAM-dependent methyltransferase [Tsukamurella conjunctivitidis]
MDGADLAYLRTADGAAAVAAADRLALTDASLLADVGAVRGIAGAHAPAVIEQVRARRRAVAKLGDVEGWLLTDEAVQQATPSAVAEHRARRLAWLSVHDVTCSIGAELRALVQVCPRVVGSDLDPLRARMAAHNVPRAMVHVADALTPTSTADVVIADPARRTGGRRIVDPEQCSPALSSLRAAYAGRSLAVKTAPGIDYDGLRRKGFDGEVEIVSLDGGVREACLWSGPVAVPGLTRATVLRGSGARGYEVFSTDPHDVDPEPAGKYLVEPDGAVIRAGLVRHYAARHGLWQLDPRIAYLTGDAVPTGERGFEILDSAKFSEKTLRAELRVRDVGSVEILTRGAGVDPDVLRRKLKLQGSQPMTVVITRIGREVVAFLTRPTR